MGEEMDDAALGKSCGSKQTQTPTATARPKLRTFKAGPLRPLPIQEGQCSCRAASKLSWNSDRDEA